MIYYLSFCTNLNVTTLILRELTEIRLRLEKVWFITVWDFKVPVKASSHVFKVGKRMLANYRKLAISCFYATNFLTPHGIANSQKLAKKLVRIETSSAMHQQFPNMFVKCCCDVHTHANSSLSCKGAFRPYRTGMKVQTTSCKNVKCKSYSVEVP